MLNSTSKFDNFAITQIAAEMRKKAITNLLGSALRKLTPRALRPFAA